MGRIANQVKLYRKMRTCAELHSIMETIKAPCPTCGSAILAVLKDGSVMCEDCDVSRDTEPNTTGQTGTAFHVILLVGANGEVYVENYKEHLVNRDRVAEINATAYALDRPAAPSGRPQGWMVILVPRQDQSFYKKARRSMTLDEIFENLPIPVFPS